MDGFPSCNARWGAPVFPSPTMGRARVVSTTHPSGFTLIELMVVVALIGILAAVIGFSLTGGSQAASLEDGQRNLLAMIQAAKANAVLEGSPARLIIYADAGNPINDTNIGTVGPKVLRYYGVIYSTTDSTGNVTWTAANQGAYLPSGIYFVPAQDGGTGFVGTGTLPPKTNTNNALTTSQSGNGHAFGTMTLASFPSSQPQPANNGGDTYYYVEFTPDGIFRDATSGATTANLIIGTGNPVSDRVVDFQGSNNKNLSGVQLRFLGIAPFSGLEDIIGSQ